MANIVIIEPGEEILDSNCEVLVNTVNCVGVMGTGVAAAFKAKFPEMFKVYKELCRHGNVIKIGKLWMYDKYKAPSPRILCFTTKDNWRGVSFYSSIEKGLQEFVKTYKEMKIVSIAFPMLGCRNGGLDKDTVKNMMVEYLKPLDIDYIEIYDTTR